MAEHKLKIILMFAFLGFITLAYAITEGCGDEVDINTACVIRTPPITCSTYDLFNSTNNLTIDDGSMEEVITGSGVYNFTFNPNASGIHTIVLCDNTSTQINVETTDETDLGTILSNQATLQDNIETVNQTVKDMATAINNSILYNLTIQHGLTLIMIGNINQSILTNISTSILTATISSANVLEIGQEAARQILKQNLTIRYGYNRTSFAIVNADFNYSGIGIFLNESYDYDDENYLMNVTRSDHLG